MSKANFNAAQGYKDLDGLSKSFTYVDHDVKLKVGFNTLTDFNIEWDSLEELSKEYSKITEKYLKDNNLEEYQINLGHLRDIQRIISDIK